MLRKVILLRNTALALLLTTVPQFGQVGFSESYRRAAEERRRLELEREKLQQQRELEEQRLDIERERLELERQNVLGNRNPSGKTDGVSLTKGVSAGTLMSPAELQATGVGSLTPAQQTALDEWLTGYTLRVLEVAAKWLKSQDGSHYGGPVGKHTLSEKSTNGAILILEDQSTWEVTPLDTTIASLWLPLTAIVVLEDHGTGTPGYLLVNMDNGEKVSAKLLGRR